jgi:hypothetical protein
MVIQPSQFSTLSIVLKSSVKREKWVVVRDTTGVKGEGTEFINGFEGSQA